MSLSLLYSLLASLLLHALLLAFGPDVRPPDAPPPESLTEVELVRRAVPLPGPPRLNLPKPVPPPGQMAVRPIPPGEVVEDIFQAAQKPDPSKPSGERRASAGPAQEAARLEEELARLLPLLERPEPARPPIRGPAASRRILFQPPPPQVEELGEAEDIVLRFWVLPDGTVGRVIPIRKGSARLEGIAATHLKRWRFSPIPPHEAPREEWGVIAFRFRMR